IRCYLHSFPTRRSSDLSSPSVAGVFLSTPQFLTLPMPYVLLCSCSRYFTETSRSMRGQLRKTLRIETSADASFLSNSNWDRLPRSEEHTSELQSLRHLV